MTARSLQIRTKLGAPSPLTTTRPVMTHHGPKVAVAFAREISPPAILILTSLGSALGQAAYISDTSALLKRGEPIHMTYLAGHTSTDYGLPLLASDDFFSGCNKARCRVQIWNRHDHCTLAVSCTLAAVLVQHSHTHCNQVTKTRDLDRQQASWRTLETRTRRIWMRHSALISRRWEPSLSCRHHHALNEHVCASLMQHLLRDTPTRNPRRRASLAPHSLTW
jgi:hypothetical protein